MSAKQAANERRPSTQTQSALAVSERRRDIVIPTMDTYRQHMDQVQRLYEQLRLSHPTPFRISTSSKTFPAVVQTHLKRSHTFPAERTLPAANSHAKQPKVSQTSTQVRVCTKDHQSHDGGAEDEGETVVSLHLNKPRAYTHPPSGKESEKVPHRYRKLRRPAYSTWKNTASTYSIRKSTASIVKSSNMDEASSSTDISSSSKSSNGPALDNKRGHKAANCRHLEQDAGNPKQSPAGNPKQSLVGNPKQSPAGNPKQSPAGNPKQSPAGNPKQSPVGNPKQSLVGNPKQSSVDILALCRHLKANGLGDPIMSTHSHDGRYTRSLPPGVRARCLPRDPSTREKIKGRARLDCEMANLRAVAFCEQQRPRFFRTASADLRDDDVRLLEEEVRENLHRDIKQSRALLNGEQEDQDDASSLVGSPLSREELFGRIEAWAEDVRKAFNGEHS